MRAVLDWTTEIIFERFLVIDGFEEVDDENPMYTIDFRQVPNDLLLCVSIEMFKHLKKARHFHVLYSLCKLNDINVLSFLLRLLFACL